MPVASIPFYQAASRTHEVAGKTENLPAFFFGNRVLLPGALSICRSRDMTAARVESLQIALALKTFQAGAGQYPESLQNLVPALLPQLPTDPFTGHPYIYRREGSGFVVYSVGSNLQDDGGKFVSEGVKYQESDIGCRCAK
jgi:hypothetical protein